MSKEACDRKRSIFCGPLEKELRKRLVKCFGWSVALYGAETLTLRRNKQKRLEELDMDVEKNGACKMDRHNKKCGCAGKSGGRKNKAGSDKEEKKNLAGLLAKKELPAEGYSRRNGKREESSRQKKISDDKHHHDKWTVCR